jgi:hypothetical protein
MKDRAAHALLTDINDAFYQAPLRQVSELEGSNWFAIARRLLDDRREDFWTRVEMVKDRLAVAPRAESGTHPSLTMRMERFGQNIDVLLSTQSLWERARSFDNDFEEQLSAEFAVKLRPWFYAASTEAGGGLPENLKPGTTLKFVCLRESCPRSGHPELSLSDSEPCLYGKDKPTIIPWTDVAYSKVITQTTGFLTEIAVNIIAEIREVPSNRTLIVHLRKGRKIVVPHWHCGGNALEIEACYLWRAKRPVRIPEALGGSIP